MNTDSSLEKTTPSLDAAERQITSGMKLSLRGETTHLTNPLFAINWFDARPAWVYHVYNFLAASRLTKIGGKALFKGRVAHQLSGDESLARQHLLIVNYPSADHFLNLVADKVFQVFSVLRMVSVRRFSFVMHRRLDEGGRSIGGSEDSTAVLHFTSHEPAATLRRIEAAAAEADVRVVFVGREAVRVFSESQGNENAMEYVTPNTMLLTAANDDVLNSFFTEAPMRDVLAQTPQHYAAILKRSV